MNASVKHTQTPFVGSMEPSVTPYVNIPVSWNYDHFKYLKTSSLYSHKIFMNRKLLVDKGGFSLQQ